MKIVSWNVNGFRASWDKGLKDYLEKTDAQIVCLQETKMQERYIPVDETWEYVYWCFSERKGYSGVACLCRKEPLSVRCGIGEERFDKEGRTLTLEYKNFFLVNAYVPNSKGSLERYYFRMDWDEKFREYLEKLKRIKPVIVCGDFNVAFAYIDIYPENFLNEENPSGFLDEERDGLQQVFDVGFIDSFRFLYPEKESTYSWWSNRLYKRSENRGWRIDYFLVDECWKSRVVDAGMHSEVYGSDHCPIYLEIKDE